MRYPDPGPEVARQLEESYEREGAGRPEGWIGDINSNYHRLDKDSPEAVPWRNNCGEASRCYADAVQGVEVRPAFGDLRRGESFEMREWAGTPGARSKTNPEGGAGEEPTAFTERAWSSVEERLREQPVGTVAIVGVDWEPLSPALARSSQGGHWFNAEVTSDGLRWADAQTGRLGGWPPSYDRSIWRADGIMRTPRGTWKEIDLG